jgi:parallel beta-helix repeat protein
MRAVLAFVFASLGFACGPVLAVDYYVAPIGANIPGTPDGSQAQPFPSIAAAFSSKKITGGDTLFLMDGPHGEVNIYGQAFTSPVVITSINPHKAQLENILLGSGTRNIILRQLQIVPTNPNVQSRHLVRSYADTSDITVEQSWLRSNLDAFNFRNWSAATWQARKFDAVFLQGARSKVLRNRIVAVNMGIVVDGPDALVERNYINGFNADGMRGNGRNNVFRNNRVLNCVQTDGNHADGFQSFAISASGQVGAGSVDGLVLDGNVFIEWTDGTMHPLRCALQGIGMFNGFYDNLTITNNLVATRAYHGIAVYGARNGTISNNTVVNVANKVERWPWILLASHQSGAKSTDVVVANNLAMAYMGASDPANRVNFGSNSVIGNAGTVFLSPDTLDYRPTASSGFIDAADPALATAQDILRQKRTAGGAPDLGAYETQTTASPTGNPQTGGKWIMIPKAFTTAPGS